MRKPLALICCLCCISLHAQMRIMSYNVENLFDAVHDTLKSDTDFTPDGKYHWTWSRYRQKLEHLSRVVVSVGEWNPPVVVGLCEVENENCLNDLVKKSPLRNLNYSYIHKESPDERGIDCALLYDNNRFHLLNKAFLSVPMPTGERPTRDIVYAEGVIGKQDTLHVMMCHLPSQLGGIAATAHKRAIAYIVLQQAVDSILDLHPAAQIVIMGDMNAKPQDNLQRMHNLMITMEGGDSGTHKWKGEWSCLDQFYVSDNLYQRVKAHIYDAPWLLREDEHFGGTEPLRCYYGLRWQNGYSDHLPVYLDIR